MNDKIKLLLSTISQYCAENPEYCFWSSNKLNYYRLYLGYKTTYENFKANSKDPCKIINDKFIKETDLIFEYGNGIGKLSKIQMYHKFDNKDINRYKLFTYCRERVDNEFLYINCFSNFFNSLQEPIDIEKCLEYGNFKNVKDWDFFVCNFTKDDLNKIWSNYPQVMSLANYFNDNFNTEKKKEFLQPIGNSKELREINEQSLNFYQFLTNVFDIEDIKKYSDYDIVQKSLKNLDIYNEEDIPTTIEKIMTNQNFFKIKGYESYSITECNAIYLSIINEMNQNKQLQTCGLITIDAIINKQEYQNVFYINTQQSSLFNKEHFKHLFMETLQTYLLNPKIDDLKEIIPTIINNWYLQNILESKPKRSSQLKI